MTVPYLIGSFALVLGVVTALILLGLLGLAFLRTGSSWIDTHAQRRRIRRRAIQRADLQTNLNEITKENDR